MSHLSNEKIQEMLKKYSGSYSCKKVHKENYINQNGEMFDFNSTVKTFFTDCTEEEINTLACQIILRKRHQQPRTSTLEKFLKDFLFLNIPSIKK